MQSKSSPRGCDGFCFQVGNKNAKTCQNLIETKLKKKMTEFNRNKVAKNFREFYRNKVAKNFREFNKNKVAKNFREF